MGSSSQRLEFRIQGPSPDKVPQAYPVEDACQTKRRHRNERARTAPYESQFVWGGPFRTNEHLAHNLRKPHLCGVTLFAALRISGFCMWVQGLPDLHSSSCTRKVCQGGIASFANKAGGKCWWPRSFSLGS